MSSLKTSFFIASVALTACAASAEPDVASLEGELASPIVVSTTLGGKVTKQLAVSGQRREPVPVTAAFTCGVAPYYGTSTSNVTSVELKNPTANIVSIDLAVAGPANANPELFVYSEGAATPKDCRSFTSTGRMNVILEPNSAVKAVVATGSATGLYSVTATTEVASLPPQSVVDIASIAAASVATQIFVSGTKQHVMPVTASFTCGSTPYYGSTRANGAWVTLQNPTDKVAVLSVRLAGVPESNPVLYSYAALGVESHKCITYSTTRTLAGATSVVIDPHAAAQILVGVATNTGVYDLTATTEALVEAE